jgi:hypothetical protein
MSELVSGDPCWVYIDDDTTYEKGVVAQLDAKAATVKFQSGSSVNVQRSLVLKANKEKQDGVADNTFLRELNEATILHNVGVRYAQDDGGCYTTTGHILIAVNPFRELKIYDDSQVCNTFAPAVAPVSRQADACGSRRMLWAPSSTPTLPCCRLSDIWAALSGLSRRTSTPSPTACTAFCCHRARARQDRFACAFAAAYCARR